MNWEERDSRWMGWWRLRMVMALSTRWALEEEEREENGESGLGKSIFMLGFGLSQSAGVGGVGGGGEVESGD